MPWAPSSRVTSQRHTAPVLAPAPPPLMAASQADQTSCLMDTQGGVLGPESGRDRHDADHQQEKPRVLPAGVTLAGYSFPSVAASTWAAQEWSAVDTGLAVEVGSRAASFGDVRTRDGWSFQEEAWQPWFLLLSWKGLIYWGVRLWAQEGPSQVLLPCGVTVLMGTVTRPCQGTCRVRVHDEACTGESAPPLHFLGPRVSLDPWHCRDHPLSTQSTLDLLRRAGRGSPGPLAAQLAAQGGREVLFG